MKFLAKDKMGVALTSPGGGHGSWPMTVHGKAILRFTVPIQVELHPGDTLELEIELNVTPEGAWQVK